MNWGISNATANIARYLKASHY